MLKPTRLLAIAVASLVMLAPRPVAAGPMILPGTTPLTHSDNPNIPSGSLVLPIEITGAVNLVNWQFDLLFDPNVVQVSTNCDSSSGDPYCDLFNGPVTEGPFTSSDFVLLNPGFIITDALLNQTGQLLGVEGAYQGLPPGPSGNGVLAYVEFVTLDPNGDPGFSVENVSVLSVPEPATLALLAGGLAALLGVRRRTRRIESQGL